MKKAFAFSLVGFIVGLCAICIAITGVVFSLIGFNFSRQKR